VSLEVGTDENCWIGQEGVCWLWCLLLQFVAEVEEGVAVGLLADYSHGDQLKQPLFG
jgi:hypothetical protein